MLPGGIVTSLTNAGSIIGGINNAGTIQVLNNLQGAGNPNGPLSISGSLPTRYNIIIVSPTQYGQLLASNATGRMAFGVYGGAGAVNGVSASNVALGTYTAVLQGVRADQIDATTLSGRYGGLRWDLVDPDGDSIWDLILRVLGPDAGRTLIALQENAGAVRSVINMRAATATNALEYDCSVFDANGFCVTVGLRYGQVGSDNNEFAGLITAAYRLSPEVRIGAFLDQTMGGDVPDGLRMNSRAPLFGGFLVYEQNQDFTGLRLRASVSYQEGKVRITRRELADTEPGQGTGDLRTFGFGVEASYGFRVAQGWTLAPYGGVRRVESARNSYTESTTDAVEYPISYDNFGQFVTSAIAGVRVRGALTDRLALVAGAGVEYDLFAKMDSYAGTSNIPDLERFSINMGQNANEFRGVGSVGVRYNVASNQQLMLDAGVRQTPYSNDPNFSTMLRYAVGL